MCLLTLASSSNTRYVLNRRPENASDGKGEGLNMNIENPRLRVRRLGGYWDLWIYYTATFTQGELNTVFHDMVDYWEHDPDWSDQLSLSDWFRFTARNTREDIEWEWLGVPEDVLDTEWGDEELKGRVKLFSELSQVTIERWTPIVEDVDA
jgi:hypothetical protein